MASILGQSDGSLMAARALLGPSAIIGITCHDSLMLAQQAQASGADYVAFGAFFPSATKPTARPAPLELLRKSQSKLQTPVVAIGGINSDNAAQIIENGADMIAVIGDLFGAEGYSTARHATERSVQPLTANLLYPGTFMSRSDTLFEQAQQFIPGGVNSPVRAFKAVGGTPVFVDRAEGAYLYDADGKRYIDYVLSWGPMILGHAHPAITQAVVEKMQKGLSFGTPTEIETELAAKLCELLPHIDLVRMVSSGTEATMSAIRLARGYTGRDKIIKFEGCYHGHSDSLLVKAGSGALTLGVPSSPGVPEGLAQHTVTLTYNDIEGVKQAFSEIGDQVACIIVEPVAGNMNCVPPVPGFPGNPA